MKQSGVDWFITADTFMRKLQNFPWPPQRDLIFMERELPQLKGSAKRWGLAIKFLTAGFMIRKLGLDTPVGGDEAVLMFTSGSSGEPKGYPLPTTTCWPIFPSVPPASRWPRRADSWAVCPCSTASASPSACGTP